MAKQKIVHTDIGGGFIKVVGEPVKAHQRRNGVLTGFLDMLEVGESLIAPQHYMQRQVSAAASVLKRRKSKAFATRKVDYNGPRVQVWRIV